MLTNIQVELLSAVVDNVFDDLADVFLLVASDLLGPAQNVFLYLQ